MNKILIPTIWQTDEEYNKNIEKPLQTLRCREKMILFSESFEKFTAV